MNCTSPQGKRMKNIVSYASGGRKKTPPRVWLFLRFGLRDYISKILEYNKLPKINFHNFLYSKIY